MSQPAISRSLHDLENELGVKFFTRQGRKLALTDQGSFFHSAVEQILEQLTAAKKYPKDSSNRRSTNHH
ncbi:LysR family transcriptional regulator [[Lactobacillus] timonensis]|uniref:LysR family transcriptional regulator n=1 Tax=[Lactobacillus] timonensis TaxID=1970790 RepID=UPI003B58F2B6